MLKKRLSRILLSFFNVSLTQDRRRHDQALKGLANIPEKEWKKKRGRRRDTCNKFINIVKEGDTVSVKKHETKIQTRLSNFLGDAGGLVKIGSRFPGLVLLENNDNTEVHGTGLNTGSGNTEIIENR